MRGPLTSAYILWLKVSGAERVILPIRTASATIEPKCFQSFCRIYIVQHVGCSQQCSLASDIQEFSEFLLNGVIPAVPVYLLVFRFMLSELFRLTSSK